MKFLMTKELGRLTKWLRILGFDAEYFTQTKTSSLIIQALREERIIISRNHRIPCDKGIKIILLKNEKLKEQVSELLRELKITPQAERMFSRCILCNEELRKIEKEKVKDKVPEYVFQTQEKFITCPRCRRIYWQGTHWGNVRETLEKIKL